MIFFLEHINLKNFHVSQQSGLQANDLKYRKTQAPPKKDTSFLSEFRISLILYLCDEFHTFNVSNCFSCELRGKNTFGQTRNLVTDTEIRVNHFQFVCRLSWAKVKSSQFQCKSLDLTTKLIDFKLQIQCNLWHQTYELVGKKGEFN